MADDDEAWAPPPRDDLAEAVGVDLDPRSLRAHARVGAAGAGAPAGPVDGAPATVPSADSDQGRGVSHTGISVPGYADLVEVARGGDGVVLRARDLAVDREVAIKVVDLAEPDVRARFEREVALTVRLGRAHPHIVTVLATPETTDGRPCLVMDFHDLGSLHDRLRHHGPLPVAEVVAAGTAIADALAYAHAQGVLHRDVKPQNVLLLPTSYVLADFGIARTVDAGRTASLERFSYRHASPQVLDGASPTPADDVWSLGSTLFTLLDGRAPFAADDPDEDTALAYLRRVRLGGRRALTREDVPPVLAALISACLAPDPAGRPPGAADVLAALRTVPTEARGWDPDAISRGEVSTASSASPSAPAEPASDDVTRERPSLVAPGAETPGSPATLPATPADGPRPAAADAPLARSALSHLGRGERRPGAAPAATDDATGLAPDEATGRGPIEPGGGSDPDELVGVSRASRRGGTTGGEHDGGGRSTAWRRGAAFLGGALLVGAAIGVGPVVVDLVRGGSGQEPTQQTSTGGGDTSGGTGTDGTGGEPGETPAGSGQVATEGAVPEFGGDLPADLQEAQTGNPDLAPTGVAAVDRGTSAEITWNAPADEEVQVIVVSQVEGSPALAYELLPAGSTSFLAEGLDPSVRVCFAVVGLGMVDGALDRGASAQRCLER
ncbi:serine/threonine-protein kinase [Litorihabitans aurantiacus]|uniref:non-specific serine/threonine protein kinase n=1 Tax=Litorihabitans aurantiacus TaxID=1930061 RepID=A0AA37XDB1_9MICO|nr:serine/threonine-protein kinase [Litorihabitans aurantiacus]GMA30763.1 hypothetical protein GCM10025875_07550 [Litorihabitans aurantiacus]